LLIYDWISSYRNLADCATFIDTNNIIVPITEFNWRNEFTYTATQNCVLCAKYVASAMTTGSEKDYYIDNQWIGVNAYAGSDGGNYLSRQIFLKKGQTFTLSMGMMKYVVYGTF
jgi:hypothetical protein